MKSEGRMECSSLFSGQASARNSNSHSLTPDKRTSHPQCRWFINNAAHIRGCLMHNIKPPADICRYLYLYGALCAVVHGTVA